MRGLSEYHFFEQIRTWKYIARESSAHWVPYPFAVGLIICLFLRTHFLGMLDPHIGSPAKPVSLSASEKSSLASIWLSVSLSHDKKKILITNSQRDIFSWEIHADNPEKMSALISFLEKNIEQMFLQVALQKRMSKESVSVLLSVDENVHYGALKEVLAALAQSGISDYAFEVKQR